ncbi:acyl carrier protein [Desulfosporosinus meridiei]|uniref:Acyl carrier protein n=1 Tax=Desulfosporosinus meridiei (strain ATCC BAA-275 / DSM 13257 / KCTC 12902 / NCIMB 13706 / S10) TaxID=768704 RepID=J7IZ44_DESMD|nr:phosphopantetheine-binding protein [Desulfosporosinus meridiei]AFQ44318.1 acyl carrier protein [Desulfosporosinus meridiei DSM 13257]
MFNQVVAIITKYQDANLEKIHKDSHLIHDLSLNSLEIVEMVCDLEESFGIEIPDAHISQFKTIGDILEYLDQRTHQQVLS